MGTGGFGEDGVYAEKRKSFVSADLVVQVEHLLLVASKADSPAVAGLDRYERRLCLVGVCCPYPNECGSQQDRRCKDDNSTPGDHAGSPPSHVLYTETRPGLCLRTITILCSTTQ